MALRAGVCMQLAVASSTAEALRESLGLESESGDDEVDKKVGKRWAAPLSEAVVSLELSGRMVQVRVHERPFEVEATPEASQAIIGCLPATPPGRPHRPEARRRQAEGFTLPRLGGGGICLRSGLRRRRGSSFGPSLAQQLLPRCRGVPECHRKKSHGIPP